MLAQRILQEGGENPVRQIEFSFRVCLARTPTSAERDRLLALYEQQLQGFEQDPLAAAALVRQGAAAQLDRVDVRKLAAWMMVANALLNLDETLTKG
jgi:hypothetical protein